LDNSSVIKNKKAQVIFYLDFFINLF